MRTPKEWYKAGLRGEMKAKGVAQSPSGRPFVYGRVVVNFGGCEASAAPVHRSLREAVGRPRARAGGQNDGKKRYIRKPKLTYTVASAGKIFNVNGDSVIPSLGIFAARHDGMSRRRGAGNHTETING